MWAYSGRLFNLCQNLTRHDIFPDTSHVSLTHGARCCRHPSQCFSQILSHRPEPGALLSTLDDDDKTLAYFCVGDGSEVGWSEVHTRVSAASVRHVGHTFSLPSADGARRFFTLPPGATWHTSSICFFPLSTDVLPRLSLEAAEPKRPAVCALLLALCMARSLLEHLHSRYRAV